MKPSGQLIEFLDRNPLPWLRYDSEKQKLIMVVDNHLMQTYRACPQHYVFGNLHGYAPKSPLHVDNVARVWFLDFGVILHKMIELYYREFRKPGFDPNAWAIERATEEWFSMQMDVHSEHKEYKLIGGLMGFIGLLVQFSVVFSPQNEKIRIIGQEISFGKRGEVPLHIDDDVEIYLSGRMDLVIEDGYFIGPMDHKTMGQFRGDPGLQFETDEGPTGYIYTMSKILPQIVPEDQFLKRDCSKILMNLISKKPTTTPQERFRRVPVRKTIYQLEQYRMRMVNTAFKLVEDIEALAEGLPVYRNTSACTNWHMYPCKFRDVCRQGSKEAELATLNNGFIKAPLWDTEAVAPTT